METKPLQSPTQPRDTQHQIPRLVCHILLVAASAADNAQRPLWNNSPQLDDVTWETLPTELKKVFDLHFERNKMRDIELTCLPSFYLLEEYKSECH
jgi:hypothetical protein